MTAPTAGSRLLCDDVLGATLAADGASVELRTAAAGLGPVSATEVGLWEAGPGSDVDIEGDEVFLVLAGAGSITFDDGSVLPLRPGVLVRLHDGDRTTWHITERLRKLYLA